VADLEFCFEVWFVGCGLCRGYDVKREKENIPSYEQEYQIAKLREIVRKQEELFLGLVLEYIHDMEKNESEKKSDSPQNKSLNDMEKNNDSLQNKSCSLVSLDPFALLSAHHPELTTKEENEFWEYVADQASDAIMWPKRDDYNETGSQNLDDYPVPDSWLQ